MIGFVNVNGKDWWCVMDDLGTPVSWGYETEEEAERVEKLIDETDGIFGIPPGFDIEAALDHMRTMDRTSTDDLIDAAKEITDPIEWLAPTASMSASVRKSFTDPILAEIVQELESRRPGMWDAWVETGVWQV